MPPEMEYQKNKHNDHSPEIQLAENSHSPEILKVKYGNSPEI